MEVGSVAEWANALATMLAFGGATVAAVVAIRGYRVQRDQASLQAAAFETDLARQQQLDEMQQARRVAIWLARPSDSGEISVWVSNTSELPVYELLLKVIINSKETAAIARDSLGPCIARKSVSLTYAIKDLLLGSGDAQNGTERLSRKVVNLNYTFTDAAGVRWSRSATGRLTKISSATDFEHDGV
jgi:hypothetical protein